MTVSHSLIRVMSSQGKGTLGHSGLSSSQSPGQQNLGNEMMMMGAERCSKPSGELGNVNKHLTW